MALQWLVKSKRKLFVLLFTIELEKLVKELYSYEAGVIQDQRSPLDAFLSDDPELFLG